MSCARRQLEEETLESRYSFAIGLFVVVVLCRRRGYSEAKCRVPVRDQGPINKSVSYTNGTLRLYLTGQ